MWLRYLLDTTTESSTIKLLLLAFQAIARLAMFYKHESCGQCTPCREVSELKYLKHWKLSLHSLKFPLKDTFNSVLSRVLTG